MTFDALGDLNWLAVIISGVIYAALGALWYGPLFGKAWMAAVGMEPPAAGMQPSSAIYAVPLVAYLVVAVAMGLLARATASDTIPEGIVLGLVVGIGISTMIWLATAPFQPGRPQPWTLFALNSAYHLIGLLITAVIVSAWV
jgi:hypothetical protein